MSNLNQRQKQILEHIRNNLRTKGYPPSVREIGEAVGLSSSSTVHAYLTQLETLGHIKRDPTKPRAIDVLEDAPWRQKTMLPVPLVGNVTASQPILAAENIEETFPLPVDLVGSNDNIFMLTVRDESMIKAGIYNGDYILVRRQSVANNGDIVVALIDASDATVKRFYKDNGCIRLQPENDAMQPIIIENSANIAIIGKVVGLFRTI